MKDTLTKNMKRLARQAPKQAASALFVEGEAIMTDSKTNYVPVDEGTLRNSGFVNLPTTTGIINKDIDVTLGFGGLASDYAVRQHEAHFNHNVGQRKYLETPLRKSSKGMAKRLADRIKLA